VSEREREGGMKERMLPPYNNGHKWNFRAVKSSNSRSPMSNCSIKINVKEIKKKEKRKLIK
jgi:hypothetical protein